MRNKLALLIPTRGRPAAAQDLLDACAKTGTDEQTTIFFGVDSDDETLEQYREVVRAADDVAALVYTIEPGTRRGMVAALNQMVRLMNLDPELDNHEFALGFMGDDHRPRTPQWDTQLLAALGEHRYAVAYGNDLLQGENLATAVVMTDDIPHILGYMAPPELVHLYVDNVWMDWGRATSLTYLPDVVLEHMHPVAGKSPLDEGYGAVNSGEVNSLDKAAYDAYVRDRLANDLKKLVA